MNRHFQVTALSTGGLKAPSNSETNLWFTGFYVLVGVPIFGMALGEGADILVQKVKVYWFSRYMVLWVTCGEHIHYIEKMNIFTYHGSEDLTPDT